MRKEAAEKDCRSVRSIRGIRRVSGRARRAGMPNVT